MPEGLSKTTVKKPLSLDEARKIYQQICAFSPDIKTNPMQTVYDIGTHLKAATDNRDTLRFLNPDWQDSDNEPANFDKEMEWYFKVNFTSNYCDRINVLRRQIDEIMAKEPDVKDALGEKISDLRKNFTKAAAPHGTIQLDVKDPGYEITPAQKQRLVNEAHYYKSEVDRIAALPKASQNDLTLKSETNNRLRNLKELLGNDMPQYQTPQLAGVETLASSLGIGFLLKDVRNV